MEKKNNKFESINRQTVEYKAAPGAGVFLAGILYSDACCSP